MALTTYPQEDFLPDPSMVTATTFGADTMDELNDEVAALFQVPRTGNITQVYFRTSTVTSSASLAIGLETIGGASGEPSGAAYGGSAVGTQASVSSNTGYTVTLGTQASATAGDFIARNITWSSSAGNLQISRWNVTTWNFPYTMLYNNTGAAWTRTAAVPVCAIKYDDGIWYSCDTLPASATGTTAYNSGTGTFDEYGIRFQLPVPRKLIGVWARCALATGCDLEICLYDATPTLVQTATTYDADLIIATSTVMYKWQIPHVSLSANTTYYLTLRPTSTNNITLSHIDVTANALLDAWGGKEFYEAKRLDNSGSFTTTTTRRPLMGLIFDGADDGVSSGSGGGQRPRRFIGGNIVY